MLDASQSLLERITNALDGPLKQVLPTALMNPGTRLSIAQHFARTVVVVLGERDAQIREHLGAILETAFRHPSGDIEAERAIHARAALLLLTPDEQDAP